MDTAAKIDKALQHVYDLCDGKAEWTMRIPVNEEKDSDCIIVDALVSAEKDYATLAAAARRLVEAERFKRESIEIRWKIYYEWADKQYINAFSEISETEIVVNAEIEEALAEVEALLKENI